MMGSTIEVRSIPAESPNIKSIAEVISHSFSADPLIRWLLKEESPSWDQLEPSTQRWQEFRVEQTALDGHVFGAFQTKKACSSGQESCQGAVLMIPTSQKQFYESMKRTARYGYFRWLHKYMTVPSYPPSVDGQRWEDMMVKHEQSLQHYTQGYTDYSYLEVIAALPTAQGSGIGKALMLAVIERSQRRPIILECTSLNSIPFYEKFGFSVVGKVVLEDPHGSASMWLMLRQPTQ